MSPLLFSVYVDDLTCLSDANRNVFITVYVDGIFLLSLSVTALQNLFSQCELELKYLDMVTNPKKTHCLRIGPGCSVDCASVLIYQLVKVVLFLGPARSDTMGIFSARSRYFKCTLDLWQAQLTFIPI